MPIIIKNEEQYGVPAATISGCTCHGSFSLSKTFDCGQAFRFDPISLTELQSYLPKFRNQSIRNTEKHWEESDIIGGTAFGKTVFFIQHPEDPDTLTVLNADREACAGIWVPYLALDTDYAEIDRFLLQSLPRAEDRQTMEQAVSFGKGIRILRQDPFEAIVSFIISQNNNIPRIKKIIAALCQTLGEETDIPHTYAFPTADAICRGGLMGLAPIRAGFRGKYILDAAEKISTGTVDLNAIRNCTDFDAALSMLREIKGIGPKVGSCALLFGFGRTEAFPVDVWMKKSLETRFPKGLDIAAFGKYAGIAQQYLFYLERFAV